MEGWGKVRKQTQTEPMSETGRWRDRMPAVVSSLDVVYISESV